jgi:hypothetical protein
MPLSLIDVGKGDLLHFIVDSGSQKNLISAEVIKQLDLPMTPHPQPYTIGWLRQGRDIVSANNSSSLQHQALQRRGIV